MSSSIHFLKTGHCDCIILESKGHFAMIDAAEDNDYPADKPHLKLKGYEKEICDYLLKNCSDANGRVTLDFVLGTHCHSDHIGGFDTVINHPDITVKKAFLKPYHGENIFILERRRWDNEEIYTQMKEALIKNNVPIIEEFDNYQFSLGDFKITFFNGIYKKPLIRFGENVNSVVTLVEKNGLKALLTGDMNYKGGGERKIADKVGKVDLLKVGHHGYTGSTSFHLLRVLKPKYSIVCNSRKRIHSDILFKLKNFAKSDIICTEDENGIKAIFKNQIIINTDIM